MGHTTEDWTFDGLWPFAPRWFDTPEGRLHYVDEGPRDSRPVVLTHGNPAWGFLYRHFIPPLVAAGHRVIVPDHLGFGRSDKPDDAPAYALTRHADRLGTLLDGLDLEGAVVSGSDWGGPLVSHWAVARPERVAGLFVLNTSAHRPRPSDGLPLPVRVLRAPVLGEALVKGAHLFVRGLLLWAGVRDRARLTPTVRAAYLAPHPTWASRTGILAFPRQIPGGPEGPEADFLGAVEQGLEERLADVCVHIAWAMRDIAFGADALARWRATFPAAAVTELPDAGHFLEEDAHEEIVPVLLRFLAGLPDGQRG